MKLLFGKYSLILCTCSSLIFTNIVSAQTVLFDFDNAPLYTSLPINQTASAITLI
ncbi:hypothetical protein BH11BAC1_BH11BAC1_07170 [soil metagenome]